MQRLFASTFQCVFHDEEKVFFRGGTEGVRVELEQANEVEITVLSSQGAPLADELAKGADDWWLPVFAA